MRHIIQWRKREEYDAETGLRHLAQAAWNLLACMWYDYYDASVIISDMWVKQQDALISDLQKAVSSNFYDDGTRPPGPGAHPSGAKERKRSQVSRSSRVGTRGAGKKQKRTKAPKRLSRK